jgi:hypothetical protein
MEEDPMTEPSSLLSDRLFSSGTSTHWAPGAEARQAKLTDTGPPRRLLSDARYPWEQPVAERIAHLMNLPVGWDGYKGRPLTRVNAQIAMQLLATVCAPDTPCPALVPLSSGGLQVEWHRPTVDLEITIFSPRCITVYVSNQGTGEDGEEWSISSDFSSIVPHVRALSGAS